MLDDQHSLVAILDLMSGNFDDLKGSTWFSTTVTVFRFFVVVEASCDHAWDPAGIAWHIQLRDRTPQKSGPRPHFL